MICMMSSYLQETSQRIRSYNNGTRLLHSLRIRNTINFNHTCIGVIVSYGHHIFPVVELKQAFIQVFIWLCWYSNTQKVFGLTFQQ